MSVASYTTQLKAGGTATAFTEEPLIKYSNLVYRVTNPVKRVLSPNHEIVIRDSVTNDIIIPDSINYLDGVILLAQAVDNALEIDAYYIPLSFIGGAKEYSLEIGGDVLDNTSFHSATEVCPGYRSRAYGLHDASLSFSRYNDLVTTLLESKLEKTPIFARVNPGGGKTLISGWFIAETDTLSGDIGALEEEAFSLVLHGTLETALTYIYDYTTVEAQAAIEYDLIANYFPNKIAAIPENIVVTGITDPIGLENVRLVRIGNINDKPAWGSYDIPENSIFVSYNSDQWIVATQNGNFWYGRYSSAFLPFEIDDWAQGTGTASNLTVSPA